MGGDYVHVYKNEQGVLSGGGGDFVLHSVRSRVVFVRTIMKF